MLRILQAFAWLRWRILVNSLERSGSRDTLQRFSIATEILAPIVVFVVMVPSILILSVAGAHAGWQLARGAERIATFEPLRFVLIATVALAVFGPLLFPRSDRTSAIRLLLLPVSRGLLYLAQCAGAIADPGILLGAAIVFSMPIGMAAAGAPLPAMVALAAGMVFLAFLTSLTVVATSLIHLAVRDRRRGEWLAVIFMLVLPLMAVLPGMFDSRARRAPPGSMERLTETSRTLEHATLALMPSEWLLRATRSAAQSEHAAAGVSILALAAGAALLHGAGVITFSRVLNSPAQLSSARRRAGRSTSRPLPLMSAAVSAVAVNQLRIAWRTPRGRTAMLSPVAVFVLIVALLQVTPAGVRFGGMTIHGGLPVALLASVVALLAVVPFAMNQFAIDRAGLTLVLLSPIHARALLTGKALGNGLIAAIPIGLCTLGAMVLFPTGSPALWMALPLGFIGTYLLIVPVAAVLSAIFPRRVDLNSVGQGSNAHGLAALIGTAAFLAAGAPPFVLVLLVANILDRPALAPLLLLVWAAVCGVICTFLLGYAGRIFDRRRESLGLMT